MLEARLEAARAPNPKLDAVAVRAQLETYIVDWQGLLWGHVYQAQQILRGLIVGRTMTPQQVGVLGKRPYYTFSGVGTVKPLLGGAIRNLASPTPASWNQIEGWLMTVDDLRRAA